MCGIAGIINIENSEKIPAELIQRMTDTMIHRGPDDWGMYVDHKLALGHRRLSILDLSPAGKQPIFDASGKFGIVFNGEIYNYLEIKEDLLQKGYSFHSNTDTEVALTAYREYGIDCLHRFNGMFAICLYDLVRNKIFLIRDRIGVKPLFYSLFDGRILFASEMKGILAYPGFPREPDMNGISSYLSFRYPVGEGTFFRDIHSLRPGHYIEITHNKIAVRQYYELPLIAQKEDQGEAYYLDRLGELLRSAVDYRMISDVPVGAYLSGGLDSSIVCALMAQASPLPVKTFTIGFAEKDYNEFDYARLVADRYKTDHHEIILSPENYIEEMQRLIRYKDAPLAVANEPALYVMSKELKKYITVVLSGEGADEIFGGYGRIFRSPYDYERMRGLADIPAELQHEATLKQLGANLEKLYGPGTSSSLSEHFFRLYEYITWADKEKFLATDIIRSLDQDRASRAVFLEAFEKTTTLSDYDRFMWVFEKLHIVGLLHRVDTTTMATAVEARVPFIDYRVVEFALAMPFHYKLRWKSLLHQLAATTYNSSQISEQYDTPKYILKKAMEKELPAEVVWRRKMGFPVPIHRWFGQDFNNFAREILLGSKARQRGIYHTPFIEQALENPSLFQEHKFGLKIWMLVNLELWFRYYIDREN
jgi:asparagine synthase (glutamine-hydrolysing)